MTYHTIEQIAQVAGVSRNTVKKWISEGCPVIRFSPRMIRIPQPEFDDWARQKIEGTIQSLREKASAIEKSNSLKSIERIHLGRG